MTGFWVGGGGGGASLARVPRVNGANTAMISSVLAVHFSGTHDGPFSMQSFVPTGLHAARFRGVGSPSHFGVPKLCFLQRKRTNFLVRKTDQHSGSETGQLHGFRYDLYTKRWHLQIPQARLHVRPASSFVTFSEPKSRAESGSRANDFSKQNSTLPRSGFGGFGGEKWSRH